MQEPKIYPLIYWGLIVAFLLLSVVTCVLALLFGTNVIPNAIPDQTPIIGGFKGMILNVFIL
jgi:Sec-independent protein translocase protein TatA